MATPVLQAGCLWPEPAHSNLLFISQRTVKARPATASAAGSQHGIWVQTGVTPVRLLSYPSAGDTWEGERQAQIFLCAHVSLYSDMLQSTFTLLLVDKLWVRRLQHILSQRTDKTNRSFHWQDKQPVSQETSIPQEARGQLCTTDHSYLLVWILSYMFMLTDKKEIIF